MRQNKQTDHFPALGNAFPDVRNYDPGRPIFSRSVFTGLFLHQQILRRRFAGLLPEDLVEC